MKNRIFRNRVEEYLPKVDMHWPSIREAEAVLGTAHSAYDAHQTEQLRDHFEELFQETSPIIVHTGNTAGFTPTPTNSLVYCGTPIHNTDDSWDRVQRLAKETLNSGMATVNPTSNDLISANTAMLALAYQDSITDNNTGRRTIMLSPAERFIVAKGLERVALVTLLTQGPQPCLDSIASQVADIEQSKVLGQLFIAEPRKKGYLRALWTNLTEAIYERTQDPKAQLSAIKGKHPEYWH